MLQLEKANHEDAAIILRTRIAAFEYDERKYGMGPPDYKSIKNIHNSICRSNCYKIVFNTEIIGALMVNPLGNGHYHLSGVWIVPQYQSLGIGTQAMKLVENKFSGMSLITLETPNMNFQNHRFYEALGYVKVGEDKRVCEVHSSLKEGFSLFKYEKRFK